jgi:hypothetical protein
MKTSFIIFSLFACNVTNAASKVSFINVDENTVYFSTQQTKTHTSPTCIKPETKNQWTVSLSSSNGRALYSLLATAVAGNLDIDVSSALDCADINGIERAKGVSISPVSGSTYIGSVTDTVNRISWAGYTDPYFGNIGLDTSKSGLLKAAQMCDAKYSGSRVMLWDDYIQLLNIYPDAQNIWFFDAIAAASTSNSNSGNSNSGNTFRNRDLLIFKNGQAISDNAPKTYGKYSAGQYISNATCNSWTSKNTYNLGVAMFTGGKFITYSCSNQLAIACVK